MRRTLVNKMNEVGLGLKEMNEIDYGVKEIKCDYVIML